MTKTNPQLDNPFEAFGPTANDDDVKKISDELLKFKGKIVEIYAGDQSEILNFEEFSVPQNCSIIGKLVDVLDRFIILDCFYIDAISKKLKSNNIIYVNTFQIRTWTELNGNGSLGDVFLSVNDAKVIRKLLQTK